MPKRPASRSEQDKPKGPHVLSTARANTLGMSSEALEAVHNHLDAASSGASHRREASRLSFREPSIAVEIVQPGGGQTHILVACRNLSRTGLGFLHSSYVHVGTKVVLTLVHQTARAVRVAGEVVRCRHVTRTVHDVGVKFEEPINVRDFLDLDPLNQTFTCEVVDPSLLKGTLLVVAEYKLELSCVRSMLSETSLDVLTATTLEQGLGWARRSAAGVILCDDLFQQGSSADFVREVRKSGVRSPIILMSADTTAKGRARIREARADAFLAKPIQQNLLLRAVAEFLLVTAEKELPAGALCCSLPLTSPMRGLADALVDDLRVVAGLVESAARGADVEEIQRQCLRVGGSATSLGFEPIANLANQLRDTLELTGSIERSTVAINAFINACRGARKSGPAPKTPPPPPPSDIIPAAKPGPPPPPRAAAA